MPKDHCEQWTISEKEEEQAIKREKLKEEYGSSDSLINTQWKKAYDEKEYQKITFISDTTLKSTFNNRI